MRAPAAAIVVCAGLVTGACGVKGPLYLPPPPPKQSTAPARQDKPATPPAATPAEAK